MITARADVVGSLLRPQELLVAQEALSTGTISRTDFKRIEDRAVDFCVQMQEDAGLEVVTDGEMRRLSFQSQLVQAIVGNALSIDEKRAKLELLCETARRVWG